MGNANINESVAGATGTAVRGAQQSLALSRFWNKSSKTKIKEVKRENVSDDEFNLIKEQLDGMLNSDAYSAYKRYFDKFCSLLHIETNGCIIIKHKLTKSSTKNGNKVYVKYTNATKRYPVPAGMKCYHRSKVNNLTELKPYFKGKPPKGYLYSAPRIYLTLREKMPKICADVKASDQMTTYVVDEQPGFVYLDPLLPSYTAGAFYVETKLPIKCTKLTKENTKETNEDEDVKNNKNTKKVVKESAEYQKIIYDDSNEDTIAFESVLSLLGELVRNKDKKDTTKKCWDKLGDMFTHKWTKIYVDEKKFKELKEAHEVTKLENPPFNKYKTAFNTLCKAFSLSPNDVVIERVEFPGLDETTGKYKCACRYSQGQKRIIIPNGYLLTHVSPNDSIKELKPTFKSKKGGRWLYPCRRVYFTISKDIAGNKFGVSDKDVKMHKYRPKENIRVAYIDQTYTDYGTGAVYINTSFPIPVDKIE